MQQICEQPQSPSNIEPFDAVLAVDSLEYAEVASGLGLVELLFLSLKTIDRHDQTCAEQCHANAIWQQVSTFDFFIFGHILLAADSLLDRVVSLQEVCVSHALTEK